MATIDSLDIQIAGSVKKANNAVNRLVKNLDKLANSLKIDTSGLEKIGQAVDLSEISNGVKDIQKQMSGFEKSAKSSMNKVSKSIDEVVKDAQNIGKGFHIEGNLSAVEKGLQKYTNELERAKLKEKELSAKGETDTNKYWDVIVDIQKYSNIIESLNRQIESMKPVESQLEINTSGLDEAKKSLDDFARELEEFRNDMKANEEVFGGLSNAPMGMFETEINNLKQTIEELKQSFPNATQVISEFEKELQKLDGIAAGLTKEPVAVKVDTSSLDKAKDDIFDKIKSLQSKFEDSGLDFVFEGNSEQLEKEIQKVNQEIDNLFNKQDRMIELGKVDTDSFKGVIRDIENATNRLKILEDARPDALNRTLEETQKKAKESESALGEMNAKLKNLVVPPIREDNLNKLQSMLKKTEEELDRLRVKLANGLTMGTIKQNAGDKGFQNISAQIAVAEKRAEMLRNKIQDIGGSSKSTAGLEILSSAFQGLGEAAGKATTMTKNALRGIASVVSGTFSKIGQIGKRTASAIKNVASNIASSFAKIGSSSKSLKTAHSNLGNLLKTALGFATLRGVFNFAKEAVNLGSSITEVENIVNTAFGSMAQHAYDFASTATEQFGLSELAAKQYSGTMMAMLKSSGVAQAQAAKMSTTLAGLAGDIASFYNLETDEAFYKLRSAISGETEPMKQLGVNMNIVNLEAFAMSRGINKAYREMTLAEQATLRYNYIMAKTTDAQGDFAKTSGNFANQWRLLKMNIQSVAAVLGQGIIAGILPIIKALNALMGKLMQAAKAFRNFMYVLMGKKIETTTSGIVNDLGGIGDAAGNLGELGDEAEEAGKKINKNLLLPIDELNILTDTSDDLKDALGGIGDVDMGMGDAFEGLTEEPVNEWAKRIRDAFLAQDWEGLGKTIAELVNIGLKKVYDAIIDITPKVEKALKAFAEVFNSFVKYLDWDLLGRTIGAGINLITTAINALLGDDGIDFEQLGSKLSVGFRGMIDEIDWTGLGNAIGNWFMVAWRIADGFIQDMWRVSTETMKNGWEELGEAVGEGVNGVFDRIQFDQIARVLTEGFRGILESAASALDTIRFDKIAEKINAGLAVLENGLRWEHIGERITKFTSAVSKAFNDLLAIDFGSIGRIIGNGITDIIRAFNQLTGEGGLGFEQLGTNISNGLRNLFASIPWTEFGNALGNGFMIGWRILDGFVTDMSRKDGAGLTGWSQLGISLGNAINGVFEKVDFAQIGTTLGKLLTGLFQMAIDFSATFDWKELGENIANGINNLFKEFDSEKAVEGCIALIGGFLDTLIEVVENTDWEEVANDILDFMFDPRWYSLTGKVLELAWALVKGLANGIWENIKKITWEDIWNWILECFKNLFGIHSPSTVMYEQGGFLMQGLINGINAFVENIAMIWENIKLTAIDAWNGIKETISGVWENAKEKAVSVWGEVSSYLSEKWESIKVSSSEKFMAIREKVLEAWSGIREKTSETWDNIKTKLEGIWDGFKTSAKDKFDAVKGHVKDAWDKVSLSTKETWDGVKNRLEEKVPEIINGVKDKFSKLPTFMTDNGKETINGLISGIKEKSGELMDKVREVAGNVGNWFKEKLQIHSPSRVFADIGWYTIQGFVDGVDSKSQSVKDKMGDIAKGSTEAFNGMDKEFNSIGSGAVLELNSAIKNQTGIVLNAVKAMVESMKGALNNMDTHAIGNNIMAGIEGGLNARMGSVINTISSLASNISNAFSNVLGIHSPSKVFYGLAGYVMEGFENGILSEESGMLKTMESIAKAIMETFRGIDWRRGAIDIGMIVGSMKDSILTQMHAVRDASKSIMEDMKAQFVDMAHSFSDIAKKAGDSFTQSFRESMSALAKDLGNYSYSISPNLIEPFKTVGVSDANYLQRNDIGGYGDFGLSDEFFSKVRQSSYEGQVQAQSEMLRYLADIAQNTRETADKDMSVRIGDRDIHDANKRAEARLGWTF